MTKQLTTTNPTTGETIASYELMNNKSLMIAIEQCNAAFEAWRHIAFADRAKILKKIGQALRDNSRELSELMTCEMGKLLSQSVQEIELCANICNWTSQHGPEILKNEARVSPDGSRGLVVYAPIGVVYGIQPWNFPAYQVVRYSIANLMAGNGVLLKHAETVTGTGKMLEQIYEEAGLPEHLFKVLPIDHAQSDTVIDHDLVRGVTLTGSPEVGELVAARAGQKLKKTVLELGSNDAYIVLADADIDLAVKACVKGRIYNNGETCIAAKRFILVDDIYDDFRAAFVDVMKNIEFGDPMKDDIDMGPMARDDLRQDLHRQVCESVDKGARILCGGAIPEDSPGYFYPATVLDSVEPLQPAYEEELFGPVAALIGAKDAKDAMRIANDSQFGLGGGVFSRDTDGAVRLAAEHFDTGMVFVNGFGLANPNMPFGGVKRSGYGREHGGFGLKEFVNVKAINVAV